MKDPGKKIRELEMRNEKLENALEAIQLEARKTGVKVADLRRAIALAVMDVRNSGQEIDIIRMR